MTEYNYGIDGINTLENTRKIILKDLKIAACGMIPDEVIKDYCFEIARNEIHRLTEIYIRGLLRAEVLQHTEKSIVLSTPEYPASLWDCVKQYLNEKLKTKFKLKTTYKSTSSVVTFERNACYPHMPSLKKEYGTGRYVIREHISISDERSVKR